MATAPLSMALLAFLLLLAASTGDTASDDDQGLCSIQIAAPLTTNVVLTSVDFSYTVTLSPFISEDEPLPKQVYYRLWSEGNGTMDEVHGSYTRAAPSYSFTIETAIYSTGHHSVYFNFSTDESFTDNLCPGEHVMHMLSIPGPLTLLPPILTAIIAIAFRQVLIALLLGIWTCAFFAYKYNPLVATLRTIDKYFVESVADFEHSQIAVFSFFLGGLIGVVQKGGGGTGLAVLLNKLTGSRRKASIACIILGALIFFDDYSLVLIAGTSLRGMMADNHVSKEKFAYILKSLGPTLPSMVPISSWIGVQVGNLQMALNSPFCKSCTNLDADPFILTISTLPYRFFPFLLLFTVLMIAISNRDFGPILTAERKALPAPPALPSLFNSNTRSEGASGEKGRLCPVEPEVGSDSEVERVELSRASESIAASVIEEEEEIRGPLTPKKGIKKRWFNAAIPILITMLVTLLGMILDGWQSIRSMPESERIPMTVINIFTKSDSVAALIWASALACVVAMVMLLIQRIVTLEEYMQAWMEGVKDIIEPYMVLWLAWALGAAIQDIQTTNYLAKTLSEGGLDAKFIPAIVTVIGFAMSFAAGSAFGTMGIIFPLVIPTVCKLSQCNKTDVLQSSAAILASSIFGNVISPIAGICILTVFASQCPLTRHIKSAALYVVIIGAVSVLFGSLPVGAGWYPWYEAWLVMAVIMVVIFVLFSSNTCDTSSISLMEKLFPSLYSGPPKLIHWMREHWFSKCSRNCLVFCSCRKKKETDDVTSSTESDERTTLLT